jgi:hypothetical protein
MPQLGISRVEVLWLGGGCGRVCYVRSAGKLRFCLRGPKSGLRGQLPWDGIAGFTTPAAILRPVLLASGREA